MNNKLKKELKKLKIAQKERCVLVNFDKFGSDTLILDFIAKLLESGYDFILVKQGCVKDGLFIQVIQKIAQLISIYGATLSIEGSVAVSYFIQPDSVVLADDDLPIDKVNDLLGENVFIGLICDDIQTEKIAIKSGVDYLMISTPSISTNNVAIEYAKWVYENINIPVFVRDDKPLSDDIVLNATQNEEFIVFINSTKTYYIQNK